MVKRLLLQTTIPSTADDWHIGRFSLLAGFLAEEEDARGAHAFHVTARDRDSGSGPDSVLSKLDDSTFDELWLFAVDTGAGLSPEDCAAITRFQRRGGGLMITRDHMDLGSSLCGLGGVGLAHHFHSRQQESDADRRRIDDPYTTYILWPNYHSGANGDYQRIEAVGDVHPVLRDPRNGGAALPYLPAHPHEGAVSADACSKNARVIATGRSKVTQRPFNIAVAFEAEGGSGRALAQSTFHHFSDCNWNGETEAPSFVDEPPGSGMNDFPEALRSTKQYMRNVADWLAERS